MISIPEEKARLKHDIEFYRIKARKLLEYVDEMVNRLNAMEENKSAEEQSEQQQV